MFIFSNLNYKSIYVFSGSLQDYPLLTGNLESSLAARYHLVSMSVCLANKLEYPGYSLVVAGYNLLNLATDLKVSLVSMLEMKENTWQMMVNIGEMQDCTSDYLENISAK